MTTKPLICLSPCPKGWVRDQDKSISPEQTIRNVEARLAACNLDIVAEVNRVDTGRLGIPVYLCACGADARDVMPVRKQMGKGSSIAQANASALMELMERFAFFSFWQRRPHIRRAGWKEAEQLFGDELISMREMLLSVRDCLDEKTAREILDLLAWDFYPATNLGTGRTVWLPLDWFRMLGEFNGSSAGNTQEESLLQGLCELVERHVSCLVATQKPALPTIDKASCADGTLAGLLAAFERNGINIILKDFSLDMPVPTVAALAWDPATFPEKSEIVFTAGTASTPVKAAIRAVTETAQLGGDFCTNSCYEASGLPKFSSLDDCQWLLDGALVPLSSLPDAGNDDIREELLAVCRGLAPVNAYGIETTAPATGVPAHYCVAPGLQFLERDSNQSLGLFVGRKLAEETELPEAATGLSALGRLCPDAHYLPFFRGLLALRAGDPQKAFEEFERAIPLQPDEASRAMATFYAGHALTLDGDWTGATPFLAQASSLNPAIKEYANLLGVALFRQGDYKAACDCFEKALKMDKGSAIDLANRGLCQKFLGNAQKAAHDLRAALRLDPGLDFARRHLAEIEGGQ